MSKTIAYTVRVEFTNQSVAEEWIAWLRDEHLAEVLDSGALDAEVIRMDAASSSAVTGGGSTAGAPVTCEVRYHFVSREAFATYERDHAPRLRAEGLRRFPFECGVTYERSLGVVASARSR